jgi:hypothetical protein
MNRAVLFSSLLFSFSVSAAPPEGPAPGATEQARPFKIAAGAAPTALTEYSQQSDRQVLFDFKKLRHRHTHSVTGLLTPSEALKQMLEGTGLVADNVDGQTIAIAPK